MHKDGIGKEQILEILANNLTNESKWFLWVLRSQEGAVSKEELREIANKKYEDFQKKNGSVSIKPLISSRHGLDIHTARMEGAGLVKVQEKGRVRLYYLTKLAEEVLDFIAKQ